MAKSDSGKELYSVVKYTYDKRLKVAFYFGYIERIDEQLGKQGFN